MLIAVTLEAIDSQLTKHFFLVPSFQYLLQAFRKPQRFSVQHYLKCSLRKHLAPTSTFYDRMLVQHTFGQETKRTGAGNFGEHLHVRQS